MKTGILLTFMTAILAAQTIPSGSVSLTIDEYNKLVELANQPVKPPDTPPVPFVIHSASLKVRAEGDSARVTAQIEGEVLARSATKVPLASGLTVFDAQQLGAPLAIHQENGVHTAILDGAGPFTITLQAGLPVTIGSGRASIRLPAFSAGTVRLSFQVAGEHSAISLSPGLITAHQPASGSMTIDATLVPSQPATLSWATREVVAPPSPKEVRFLSDIKTLVSVREAEIALASLVDISVVQGEPAQFEIEIPDGFEVTGATGATLDSSEVRPGVLTLRTASGTQRSHQFLISLEKPIREPKLGLLLPRVGGTQRETGETLVEGEGAMELTATEDGGLKRMDLKEVHPLLRSMAHNELHAAFRYHRQPADQPSVALAWTRFPESGILAAVADRGIITTLVTTQGRSLTEVKLIVRNQAQPFLKVGLPPGASIVTADVAGQKVKPVEGADGNRVPLLRPGFRPSGPYEVSWVFVHSDAPFAKKGGAELGLPKMDVPIGLLRWEVFLPERYKVSDFAGDAIPALLVPDGIDTTEATTVTTIPSPIRLAYGQLTGVVTDASGGVIPHATISVRGRRDPLLRVMGETDDNGRWLVSNIPSGQLTVQVESPGFKTLFREVDYDSYHPGAVDLILNVGDVTQTVEVTASAMTLQTESASLSSRVINTDRVSAPPEIPPSANVTNLQKRVSGVLPIAVDVPRTGHSYRFVRALVVDEETKISFRYRASK